MSKKATIIAVVNQKGGTGKTTTTENLGVGLALEGKKVLLVDTDPQASLTVSLGNPCPDDLSPTLSDLMGKIMMEKPTPKRQMPVKSSLRLARTRKVPIRFRLAVTVAFRWNFLLTASGTSLM